MGKKIFRLVVVILLIGGAFWYGKNKPKADIVPKTETTQKQGLENDLSDDPDSLKEEIIGFGQNHKGKEVGSVAEKKNSTAAHSFVSEVVNDIQQEKKSTNYSNLVTDVTVYLYEWGIDVSDKDIGTGRVNFTVVNNGRFSHNFSINGVKNFGKILPGENKVFEAVYLPSGSFELFSDKSIDVEKGMMESLRVE